jgi:ABC-2 type transport system ATP-binding protein
MTKTNNKAILTTNLTKRFGQDILAVDQLSLAIPTHTIYALLGPNGAGKTTTLSMLTTLIQPSSGSAQIAGFDVVQHPKQVRRQIGVTFQEIVLDPDLTGRETLEFHARLYGIKKTTRRAKIAELLNLVELEEAADRRTHTYSGGMKRRLELARGLLTDPAVLFLDEPTQGLDPQNRANIWDYIRTLKTQSAMTIMLTTHYMEEAEALADQVGIMDHGKIVVEGTPAELIAQMGADNVQIMGHGSQDVFSKHIQARPYVESFNAADGILQVGVDAGNRRLVDIVEIANQCNFTIEDIAVSKPSLGDVFLKFTGRQLRDK